MSIPHWDLNPDSWDRLTIGKDVMPGLWTVTYSLEREVDVKKAGGVDGARFKDKGYQPTKITLAGRMLDEEDWEKLQDIFPKIHPKRKGSARSTFSINHPATRIAGIGFVYITQIDAPELQNGVLTISIQCLEYVPEPKKVPKPKAPETPTSSSVNDTPPDWVAVFPGFKNHVLDD